MCLSNCLLISFSYKYLAAVVIYIIFLTGWIPCFSLLVSAVWLLWELWVLPNGDGKAWSRYGSVWIYRSLPQLGRGPGQLHLQTGTEETHGAIFFKEDQLDQRIKDQQEMNLLCTVWCRYNVVSFLQIHRNKHPIARPHGQAMRCLLWRQIPIYVLPQWLEYCTQYRVVLDRVVTALDCTILILQFRNFVSCWSHICQNFPTCRCTILNFKAFPNNSWYMDLTDPVDSSRTWIMKLWFEFWLTIDWVKWQYIYMHSLKARVCIFDSNCCELCFQGSNRQ